MEQKKDRGKWPRRLGDNGSFWRKAENVTEQRGTEENRKRDSNECCMMHLAVAPSEAFLTLFHTIKTPSICQLRVVSPKHADSNSFSFFFSVFRPFYVCEMLDVNPDTQAASFNRIPKLESMQGF